MRKLAIVKCMGLMGMLGMLVGCASESNRALSIPQVNAAMTPYAGLKQEVVVGLFSNNSPYMRGIFSDGIDRLGNQAKTILMTHLNQSQRFTVMDRANMEGLAAEAAFRAQTQKITGAQYTVTGSVTEFGRKTVGDVQLFGILGSGKEQVAYAKVALNVVDVTTSQVVYSGVGAGEFALSNREIVGFGGRAGYDATLNGKVLDLAIREAVDRLVDGLDAGAWGK